MFKGPLWNSAAWSPWYGTGSGVQEPILTGGDIKAGSYTAMPQCSEQETGLDVPEQCREEPQHRALARVCPGVFLSVTPAADFAARLRDCCLTVSRSIFLESFLKARLWHGGQISQHAQSAQENKKERL